MIKLDQVQKIIKEFSTRLFEKNRYERTLKDYEALAREHPEDMRIQIRLAETYFKARDIPKAIETYWKIANTHVEQNFILKAVSTLNTLLKLDPTNVEINLKLSQLYLKLNMVPEAVNQLKIAMQHYMSLGDKTKLLQLSKKITELDPSNSHRRKLAEIYQSLGMIKEALEHYEIIAQHYRQEKDYASLLRVYELILPHKQDSHAMIRDICILYLRRQEPEHAIKTMERYKVDSLEEFAELYDKAKLMKKALRSAKTPTGSKKPTR